ncbi:unnamed protein product (mitochondrion) [Plasmodiophora brassicae]|uniref:Uncharacterized protein n=1 Tax=Plasmodiophora brassicae TaxID=37360 RepID=A0A3P3Y088_PLABS|nr:unnamed protein product [Plasmodiophora brassicae]
MRLAERRHRGSRARRLLQDRCLLLWRRSKRVAWQPRPCPAAVSIAVGVNDVAAVGLTDHSIAVLDVADSLRLRHRLLGHTRTPWSLCFHNDHCLASGDLAGECRLWSVLDGACTAVVDFSECGSIRSLLDLNGRFCMAQSRRISLASITTLPCPVGVLFEAPLRSIVAAVACGPIVVVAMEGSQGTASLEFMRYDEAACTLTDTRARLRHVIVYTSASLAVRGDVLACCRKDPTGPTLAIVSVRHGDDSFGQVLASCPVMEAEFSTCIRFTLSGDYVIVGDGDVVDDNRYVVRGVYSASDLRKVGSMRGDVSDGINTIAFSSTGQPAILQATVMAGVQAFIV